MGSSRPIHWAPSSSDRDRSRALSVMGISDVFELYRDVPHNLILDEPPRVGFGKILSEWELRLTVEKFLSKNTVYIDPPPFLGGGWCPHLVPALVDYIISRPEFLTAYTPYQAEINQGLMQALFEYQSLIADLVELDVVNASMYDGSTAVAEAFLMALRVTKRRKILVPEHMHPEYRRVVETWLYGKNALLVPVKYDEHTGRVSLDDLESKIDNETAAVYVENPSFLGSIEEDVEAMADAAHKKGALFIVKFEPISLGLLKPPGRYGADIAVAEGQPLGSGLNYGGPGLGIFAVRWDRKLVRQMPGRIIGLTRDAEGRRAFAMILQTREQHIRREKATSNITTNEALMAVAAAVYLTLLGGRGLRDLAQSIWLRSHYLAKRLSEVGVKAPVFESEFFKEFTARFPKQYKAIHVELKKRGILGGLSLDRYWPEKSNECLFCVTELHSMKHIDKLVEAISEVIKQ